MIPAASPYPVLLASAIASSASSTISTEATGPNVSSHENGASAGAFITSVG